MKEIHNKNINNWKVRVEKKLKKDDRMLLESLELR